MPNKYTERFFKKHQILDRNKVLLRSHPAFRLVYEEITTQVNVFEVLRHVRREKVWTQKRLAELTGFSQSFIARLESGYEKNPSLGSVQKIAEALDCRIVVIKR